MSKNIIKNYKLINAYVNLDLGSESEKICCIELDITDTEHVKIAENICQFEKGYLEDGLMYYKNGWIIECTINEDITNTLNWYGLYFVGDDGREFVSALDINNSENKEFIEDLNTFLFNELDYEYCKNKRKCLK